MVDSNDPTTPSPEPLATPKPKSQALPDPKTPATPNVKLPATPNVKTPAAQVLKTPVARTPNTPIVPILSPRGSEPGPSHPLVPTTGGLDTSVAASTAATSQAASSAVPDTTAADSTAVDATAADATATPVAAETTNINQAIPAEPELEWDADSAVDDDDAALSTASINSTILEYRKLHGRTFHVFGGVDYWGPNDDMQLNGQDVNHHMIYLALEDKLNLAPVENPQMVLDVGTGTGIWAIDFADLHPSATVIGVDLAPCQPTWVPPNCRFELDDLTKPWTFPPNHFDYIHIRWMMGCIPDWTQFYREALRCLKPGGWIEHMDCSMVIRSNNDSFPPGPEGPPGSVWYEWWRTFTDCADRTGRPLSIVDDDVFANWLRDAGFPEVHTKPVITPIGDWPAEIRMKEVGTFNKLAAEMGLEGYVLYLMTTVLGWDYATVQVWLAQVRAALRNKSQQPYMTWGVAWAQKPKN